jgi:DNA-binding MarR family transcriptional regulator/membrane protein implicated in regulation of membrane protease activity
MCSLAIVVAIMVVGGAIGGLANFLRATEGASEAQPHARTPLDFFRLIATGIAAALALPLFLSLAKSPLITDILSKDDTYPDMLIFAGFCIVAGFSAGPFLDRLSGQLGQEVRQIKGRVTQVEGDVKQTKGAVEKVEGAVEKVEGRVDSELEGLDQKSVTPESIEVRAQAMSSERLRSEARSITLTDTEHAALRALTTKAYRTRSGIAEDAGVSKTKISEILEDLAARSLVERTTSPNTGGLRFKITDLGRAVLQLRGEMTS